MDLFSLKGKNIAITGASSGFGHHFAGVLSGAGANVILGARRADKIADRVSEINQSGGQAQGIPLDVTIPDSCADFLLQAEQAFGPVDVLINNAGVEAGAKTYAMIDEDDWDFVLDTNLKSVWRLSKMYTESVVKNKQSEGNIINVASITAYRTIKGQFPYAVSKAAL
ncbi:MAG: SDR family oxidoreductase, partial [Pseudomonadales bacterium]|nr:SDR family oxidoreductase [Pseudomonadales bacterium]